MKIEKSKYSGYLWYSDKPKPRVLFDEEFELEIDDCKNPFIIEGQLFDGHKSVSIKYVDGEYIVKTYNIGDDELNDVKRLKTYIPNRMPGVGKLKFLQYWEPIKDENCEDMEVLQPSKLVFVGFETLKNKED